MGYKVNPPSSEELRQMAVQRLGVSSVQGGAALSGEQAKRLLEEVAAAKLEVEIQNVYLQDSCARLDVALNEMTSLYDFAPVGCLSTDACGCITQLNLTAAKLLGQERNTLMGRPFADFVGADQRDAVCSLMAQASACGQDQQCDVTMDSPGHVPQHAQLCVSSQGVGQGHHMVLTNITERRALEQTLRANEERWKRALDASGDGVWDWDVRSETLLYSPRLAHLYGFAGTGLDHSAAGWRERVHPEDWPGLMAAIQGCLTGQAERFDNRHRQRCLDASWKWVLCQGTVFQRCEAGKVIRMVGTQTDISPYKRLDAELLEVRGVQRAMFDSFPQYLAVLDSQAKVLQTNDLWNAFGLANGFAYRNGFVHTDYAVLLDAVTGGEGENKRAALAGIWDVIAARVPGFQLEYTYQFQGESRCYVMHVTAVREGTARAVVSHQDISRLMRAMDAAFEI